MLCVLIRSAWRGSNEYPQHMFFYGEIRKISQNYQQLLLFLNNSLLESILVTILVNTSFLRIWDLREFDTLGRFTTIVYKGDNIYDAMWLS